MVLPGGTVVIRTQVGDSDSTLSSNWRDDLLIILSCTMLNFSASSCAACSNASFFLSKAHSVAFTSTLKMPQYSSQSPLFRAVKPFFIIFPCSKCRHGVSRAPSILWLAIPAATDLVFLPAFLLQPALETSLLCFFLSENIPTFQVRSVLFPSYPKAFHDALSAPRIVSTANLSVFLLCLQRNGSTSGIGWSCTIHHLH